MVEEVVETEAITLATADGQIVRVISKEQYDRWGFLSSLPLFPLSHHGSIWLLPVISLLLTNTVSPVRSFLSL